MLFRKLQRFWHNIFIPILQIDLTMKKVVGISVALILILTSVLLYTSCVDDCEDTFDTSGGIISEVFSFGDCFSDVGALERQYVIKDNAAYQSLGILPVNTPECMSMTFPDIDFDTYSLLGLYADGACSTSFDRIVEKDENIKKYTYTVGVNTCGNCESLRFSMNWVLVPKLPDDYTVSFSVED